MEKTAVQKLAGALKVLVTVTLVCNLVALLLVPGVLGVDGVWIAVPFAELACWALSIGFLAAKRNKYHYV